MEEALNLSSDRLLDDVRMSHNSCLIVGTYKLFDVETQQFICVTVLDLMADHIFGMQVQHVANMRLNTTGVGKQVA